MLFFFSLDNPVFQIYTPQYYFILPKLHIFDHANHLFVETKINTQLSVERRIDLHIDFHYKYVYYNSCIEHLYSYPLKFIYKYIIEIFFRLSLFRLKNICLISRAVTICTCIYAKETFAPSVHMRA